MKHFDSILFAALASAAPIRAQATSYADVVIAVDTSGSMAAEAAMVQNELNQLASTISSWGIDLHIVLIAASSNLSNGICVPVPLGSGACPADSNLPLYRHNTTSINSTDAFQKILATYGSWSASLRPTASTTVIVVTDDESNMSSAVFDTQFRALNASFQSYRLHALVATNACAAGAVVGQEYINLATLTGGLVRNLCNQNFNADFAAMAVAIAGPMSNFCTAGTTTNGCVPSISGTGTPSATASNGFTIVVAAVEGQKQGHIFYGLSGALANPWGPSSTSYLCVKAPSQRTATQNSNGTAGACDGVMQIDWNAYIATHPSSLGAPFSPGTQVWAQLYFRDPPAPKTTNLSNGLTFVVGP